jgi:MoaA/NifB/PqqE/SkfB family radical SAM enzyme
MLEPFYHTRWQDMWQFADELNRSYGNLHVKQGEGTVTVGWRFVHDDGFVRRFKANGYADVQLTFFGLSETHDWFAGRKGALDDLIRAAAQAQENDLTIHVSIMIHKRMIEELPELLRLLGTHGLPQQKGWTRESFTTLYPVGRAYAMEDLRPEMSQIERLPPEVTARIWAPRRPKDEWERSESHLVQIATDGGDQVPGYSQNLGLIVGMDGNVYPDNCYMEDDWHRLGNVFEDDASVISERFRSATPPGLRVRATVPRTQLVRRFGDPGGQKAYAGLKQLTERCIRQWCENE